jgi:uncharacterized RDD family membrane protein YckC
MKCPKCGYLGFETSDRCRNCGYDFSLSVSVEPPAELPLQPRDGQAGPLADLTLGPASDPGRQTPALDLDRLIGTADPDATVVARPAPDASPRRTPVPERRLAEPQPAAILDAAAADQATPDPAPVGEDELPLFSHPGADDVPLITSPRPPRPPLVVRRATPDIPRGRSRTRVTPRRDEPPLQLDPVSGDVPLVESPVVSSRTGVELRPAGLLPRATALLVDALLLMAINAAVLYFTLAIAGLTVTDIRVLPPIPLVAFLLILNGGYLITFTTAGGQTIGKMLTGIRVMGDDGRRVDTAGAVLRAAGCLVTLLSVGLGYLPVLLSAEGRALHDRIAGTRVVESDES